MFTMYELFPLACTAVPSPKGTICKGHLPHLPMKAAINVRTKM